MSNIFVFRIWDAQFENLRFEIMKTDRIGTNIETINLQMVSCIVTGSQSRQWHWIQTAFASCLLVIMMYCTNILFLSTTNSFYAQFVGVLYYIGVGEENVQRVLGFWNGYEDLVIKRDRWQTTSTSVS